MSLFLFATGIENSYPTIGLADGSTKRIDELELTGHYARWREDFALVRELGVDALRYGPPYYRCHVGPGRYDWDFADQTFGELRRLGIEPIADLCHFGVPDWIGNFQNPEFPAYLAEYAEAFAKRFAWVRYYTPVNEMYVAAKFSARHGLWNERLTGDAPFVTALMHIARANVLATEAILRVRPDARFVQSESSEYFHPVSPEAEPAARHLNALRFLALDFNYGYEYGVRMGEYLLDHGMTRQEMRFFLDRDIRLACIMGNDYYATNEHIVYPDGSTYGCEMFGYYVITKQYYDRYRLPVMHTETNNRGHEAGDQAAKRWLEQQWANVFRLKIDGVPILRFTWFGLLDQIGRAIAECFVDAGARVALLDRSEESGRPVEAALRARARERGAGDCLLLQTDVSQADAVRAAIHAVVARWDAIDVVVNNAAVMKTGRLVDTAEADWDQTMAVNVRGPFLVCKHALPHMPPEAAIVMVSSVHAVATDDRSAAYTASKGALEALTRALAIECFERQIRVNAIRPGAVDSPMLWGNPNVQAGREKLHPLEVGGAEEIAQAVLFLASERASFISGAVLTADGGRLPMLASHAK